VSPLSTPTFGDLLRAHRRLAGLLQGPNLDLYRDLCARTSRRQSWPRKAGLSEQGVSVLERGSRRRPRTETVLALAAALSLGEDEATPFLKASAGSRTSSNTPMADKKSGTEQTTPWSSVGSYRRLCRTSPTAGPNSRH
jgi:transcriptional regulator with XRE-family HTH domain